MLREDIVKYVKENHTKETYKGIFTKEQINWLVSYENHTGFEPSYNPHWSFEQLVSENLKEFKNWSDEVIETLEIKAAAENS